MLQDDFNQIEGDDTMHVHFTLVICEAYIRHTGMYEGRGDGRGGPGRAAALPNFIWPCLWPCQLFERILNIS